MARYIIEECDISSKTKVRNFLTIGTPHMGYSELPLAGCQDNVIKKSKYLYCKFQKAMVNGAFYDFQNQFAAAGYYRNIDDMDNYKLKS